MSRRIPIVIAALAGLLAFCTRIESKSLDLVQNPSVRAYAEAELKAGAPSLPIASKLIYREALADLRAGRRDEAEQKLQLAADLAESEAAPLFTLARVEASRGNPAFFMHVLEGIRRSLAGFPEGAVLALNLAALVALSLTGALLVILVAMLVRYWPYIDHAIVERYGGRFSPSLARWIVPLVLVCLALLRLGIAFYAAALIAALWTYLSRRERAVVGTLAAVVAAASIAAPLSNRLAAAADPYSVTRRLALVNERSVSADRLAAVREIDPERYGAERAFAVGTMLSRLGLQEEAQRNLLESVSIRADFAPAFLNLGNVYFLRGDYDRALAGYRSAAEIDSTSAVAHYNIGQAYIKKMHFAQSGTWLQRANTLGFERYRAAHPALGMRATAVYEQVFPRSDLWRIAAAEGARRDRVVLSEMLQPWLLVPFHLLWILFAAAVAAGCALGRVRRIDWKKQRCHNCGLAMCPRCSVALHDARLCPDCAEVVKDLSSVKVLEALLRTKRQKTIAARARGYRWRTMIFPGIAHVCCGKTLTGFALALGGFAAVAALAWRGLYLKNPLAMSAGWGLWETIAPFAALAAAYGLSMLAKQPQEPRNYNLFAAEARSRTEAPETAKGEDASHLWLSPSSTPPPRRARVNAAQEPESEPSPVAKRQAPKAPEPSAASPWASGERPAPPTPAPRREPKREPSRPSAGSCAPPPKTAAPPKPAAPPKGDATTGPAPQGKAVEMEDFLAEIKKGSSWR